MEITKFRSQNIPKYITEGNHARFITPFAKEICKGEGLDIGCGRPDWMLSGAIPVDPAFTESDALNIPKKEGGWDFIFSSHCLEHLPNYVEALEYWKDNLRKGGILFLYLPHPDCVYWRPWMMPTRKHIHQFYPYQMEQIFYNMDYTNIFCSERDLAYSFAIFGEKT